MRTSYGCSLLALYPVLYDHVILYLKNERPPVRTTWGCHQDLLLIEPVTKDHLYWENYLWKMNFLSRKVVLYFKYCVTSDVIFILVRWLFPRRCSMMMRSLSSRWTRKKWSTITTCVGWCPSYRSS